MLVKYFDMKVVVSRTSATFGVELVMELLTIYTLAETDLQGGVLVKLNCCL